MHNDQILTIANSAQRKAITHTTAPLMIIAGAGTGKTFTLENRIVYLIKEYNIPPDNILTITYTEKAARELKTRVIENVGQKAHAMFVGTLLVPESPRWLALRQRPEEAVEAFRACTNSSLRCATQENMGYTVAEREASCNPVDYPYNEESYNEKVHQHYPSGPQGYSDYDSDSEGEVFCGKAVRC